MEFSRQTSQFYTGIGTHLPRGEFSICAHFCCSYNQSLQFSFLVPLGTHHCYMGRGGMACTTPVTHPRTDRARRCLTSVISTTRPCATAQTLWPLHGHAAAMPPSVRPSVCGRTDQDQTTKPLWFEDFCPASISSRTSELDDVAHFTTPSLLTLPTVSP